MKDAVKNAGSVSKHTCLCSDLMPHNLFTTDVTFAASQQRPTHLYATDFTVRVANIIKITVSENFW